MAGWWDAFTKGQQDPNTWKNCENIGRKGAKESLVYILYKLQTYKKDKISHIYKNDLPYN